MNRTWLVIVGLSVASSGCVATVEPGRVEAPRVIVSEPAVVVSQPVVVVPPVLVGSPSITVVPGTRVYTVPNATFNVFWFEGRYYSYHHGAWYHAPRAGVAWTVVAVDKVPGAVRAVPVAYYKIPPGQAKKWDRDDHDKHDKQDKHCPPGQAKKGNC